MAFPRHRDASGVEPSPSFPALEHEVLAYWAAHDTFQRSIDNREGCKEWVFYDGPPFANGLPHYGHLLTGYAKDIFPRFHTMRGKQVHRRFGWDTHGLPAELEAERQLGITDKSQIEAMGIAAFNQAAKDSVLRYTKEWEEYVTRQARWVDFENDYKTLDITFMESVVWAFKQLHDKGLAYEGYRVLPYCWRDQTPLSNHELRMDDDVYKARQDQSVTVTFPLRGARAEELGLTGVLALAWTTTPWTLPTNAALAVGPDIDYVVVPAGANSGNPGARYLLAGDTVAAYVKELGYEDVASATAAITSSLKGSELGDVDYERVFDYYADVDAWDMGKAWRVLVADYVATGEGTGIVHQAPAYGEDDQLTCQAAGIPVLISVDDAGKFLPQVSDVAGLQVFDANKPLIKLLRESGRLFAERSYNHSYPHCWRCRTPLIYKAVSSWFVRVTEIRDRMVELNQGITWVPGNVKDGQFGKWLQNARDWSISRNRYWGSPIPVWKSDDPDYPRLDVYGSLDELERDFGVRPTDLHRPAIDELVRPNPDDPSGKSMMRRIPDVLDVWFDSGSMPFAQVHYPFEHQDWFDSHNPADFIVEYIGQTRGWFYTMHVLATALFDRPAFSQVISHGIVLGSDGAKMSKSLRNYPDVSEVFERDGADAMRWFLMSSSVIRGGNLVVTEEGIREGVRQFLLPLWSTYYFLSLYIGDYEPQWRSDSPHVLDRYILAKLRDVIEVTTESFEALDSPMAAQAIRDFTDILTNWYVRRSRERFWDGSDHDALDTLYTVLETLSRLAAPLAPLVTEEVWRGITGGESVHLTDWPDHEAFPSVRELVSAMDAIREVASAGLALRKAHGLRVRLPLSTLTVVTTGVEALADFVDIIASELNVKRVDMVAFDDRQAERLGIGRKLSPNARTLGPRVGPQVQEIIREAKAGNWREVDGVVTVGGLELVPGEYELELSAPSDDIAVAFLSSGGFVLLETAVTPELAREGLARDTIRWIQQARKNAGFEVSDRIDLVIAADELALPALEEHRDVIAAETLALQCDIVPLESGGSGLAVGDDSQITVKVSRRGN
ncbi:MAG: isoleucine--tRNA ligase [Actinobacteria bacterium]|uniref:isoleucine--tRNA ligase n=1 Tax=freshwater metagenome TaxID=449393 RepID=A0A6J6JSJ6_9ZZZZ|nr:isoleucine--tRNA ligase [Actinomycetota bacterium]